MNSSVDNEIAALIKKIDNLVLDLTKETDEIKQRLAKLYSEEHYETFDRGEERTSEFEIGDTVEITNNYRYKKGTKGVIVRLTKSRVTLRDVNNSLHTRSYRNVRRVTDEDLNSAS